ncbi:DNA-methyltransferase [Butyrivibrio sp. YAB3001]|uniref:DNA-methyltransferase n=1 Tax=Butyrivibrio sp. YAB3001 TaxID=1520812 RepID=UPI0008F68A61|nr:site-specific DNA-methyltransferase [Butyrivibrio sp. YAB3001]SFC56472.1 site-specific DNA-methyltransferase (adenine-specific) [Butyrivibrio sp. YAB3001]
MISKHPSIYKLFNEDCSDFMKRMPSQSVDLIMTDPPYNISQYSTGNIPRIGKSTLNNDIADWDKKIIKPVEYVKDFKRIIKPRGNIIIFAGYNQIGDWHAAFDREFDTFQIFVWHKTNPAPKVYKNGFSNSCEFIIFLWNKGHVWNFTTQEEMHNFFECPICSYPERLKDPFHPTQKPIKLMEHFVRIASFPGATIFDPFMGVGTSGVAAIKNARRFVGTEIDERYVFAAQKRIDGIMNVAQKPLP